MASAMRRVASQKRAQQGTSSASIRSTTSAKSSASLGSRRPSNTSVSSSATKSGATKRHVPRKKVTEIDAELVGESTSHPSSLKEAPGMAEYKLPETFYVETAFCSVTNSEGSHANEDRFLSHKDLLPWNNTSFHTIGVADGHGGDGVSELVSRRLPRMLGSRLKAGDSLVEAYTATMADLEGQLKEAKSEAGTCVVSCTVAGPYVWCANLGDCRAVLMNLELCDSPAVTRSADKDKTCYPQVSSLVWMSKDHKVTFPDEFRRIEATGEKVVDGAVKGLRPSRTLGDFDVKSQVSHDVISIKPEVRIYQLGNGTDKAQAILVCCSDGVWDVVTGQDIAEIISGKKDLLKLQASVGPTASAADKIALQEIAEDVIRCSLNRGSSDDCTAVVSLISISPGTEEAGTRSIPASTSAKPTPAKSTPTNCCETIENLTRSRFLVTI